MIWNKPRKAIHDILYYLSLVFGAISVLSIIIILVWFYFPKSIASFDKNIPNFHANTMETIHDNAANTKDPHKKFESFTELYQYTKDLTQLESFYYYKKESHLYLVNYYLENNYPNKALKITTYWVNTEPNNFDAKFAYIKVLKDMDSDLLPNYYHTLYTNYRMIDTVVQNYLQYLISVNNLSLAAKIEQHFNSLVKKGKVSFILYYIDGNQTSFNAQQVLALEHKTIDVDQSKQYTITLEKKFLSLKGLRLDIDSILKGAKISDISIEITKDSISYKNVELRPIHSISSKDNKQFFVTGNDAHAKIVIPEEFQQQQGDYKINISLNILNQMNFIETIFLTNNEWRFLYDTGKGFNENESHPISLTETSSNYISNSTVNWRNVQKIRLDLPSLMGIELKNISIRINDNIILSNQDIIHMNAIQLKDNILTVKDEDPYLIIKLDDPIRIKSIDLSLKL